MKKYKNKKIAILGLGLEGKDAVKFLLRQKAKVFIHDRKEKKDLDLNSPAIRKLTFICGKDYLKGLETYDLIVRSPGVYRYLPEIVEAERKGIEIVSVVKIFFDLCQAKIIAVTGTKGKGT